MRPRSAGFEIFILSDVCFVREGLLTAFQAHADFSRVLAGTSIDQAAGFGSAEKPRVVLLDAAFPNAKAAARTLAHGAQHCQLIILAIEENAETVIEWLRMGASGYVPRQASIKELVATVRGVISGEQACAPATVAGLMRHISQESHAEAATVVNPVPQLTLREAEILQLLGTGCTNKQIARRLAIEVTTAKCHVHNILSKLHLQRRSQVPHWIQDQRRLGGSTTAASCQAGD
jgi:DNA-binding NarL/FixJ family response regulator